MGVFVQRYNEDHRHSAINLATPAERHAGFDTALLEKRTIVYDGGKRKVPGTLEWRHTKLAANTYGSLES